MTHSCEEYASGVLEALAAHRGAGALENDAHIVPGFYPSWDTDHGTVALSHEAGPDTLLRLDLRVTGQPRWLSLNLDLGGGRFGVGDVIGVVADIKGDCALGLFLRSASADGHVDTDLPDGLRVAEGQRIGTCLHTVAPDDPVLYAERFHTLVLRLPPRDARLEIRDMRVFVLPARDGLRSDGVTLASLGA